MSDSAHDPLTPIREQQADYAALLAACRRLLGEGLEADAVAAFRAERAAVLERAGAREAAVTRALAGPASPEREAAAGAYRAVLEDLVRAERELALRAGTERDALGRELAAFAHGRRALSGYRSKGAGPAHAVSRHI